MIWSRAQPVDEIVVEDNDIPLAPCGSSFYLSLRILPREQRLAMYAIYAFCRTVDDIADGTEPREVRLTRLAQWHSAIAGLYGDGIPPQHLRALHGAIRDFGLERRDFEAVLDGMRMDAAADGEVSDWTRLDLYCDRVACAPGRLSVKVFGLGGGSGRDLAAHLGRALQLTNILRDIDEDAAIGRVYLPAEALEGAAMTDFSRCAILRDRRLTAACRTIAARAARHFDEAGRIMDAAPRRTVRAPRLMAAAYRPMLAQLVARGWDFPRAAVSKNKLALAGAVLRYGLF